MATAPTDPKAKPPKLPKDHVRESIETVVFVVTLVLLLKLFVVEAYVIPTGSMAETLLGYHKLFDCPECGHRFPINSSDEVEPQDGQPWPVRDCKCPNCGYEKQFTPTSPSPPNESGDRVLVHKTWYHLDPPKRWDTVVFKYPADPQKRHVPMNYIKRLWGIGDETYGIHRGEVFVRPGSIPANANEIERADRPEDLWSPVYTRHNSGESKELFEAGRLAGFPSGKNGFELLRKPDVIAMAERRLVHDNDHQAKTLIEKGSPPRWWADPKRLGTIAWGVDDAKAPKSFTHDGPELSFIRYQHLTENAWANPPNAKPAPIRNVIGYNTPKLPLNKKQDLFDYWCGDLMLECRAKLEEGTVTLELSKGVDRFQARFAKGKVQLVRVTDGKETVMTEQPTSMLANGTYDLRFANIDCRLRVWVNGKPIDFGSPADYSLAPVTEYDSLDTGKEGWTIRNDIEAPASIGATGRVSIDRIKLWRDTVYTAQGLMNRPERYADYVDTFYVHPGHYLCLGDNSAQSSDSRDWGTVPERLMLGRACFIFWPFTRIGFIK
jgi:signal peptidase I